MPASMWKPGDRLSHRFNPDLGPGEVRQVRGRQVLVHFRAADQTLGFALDADALVPLVLAPGTRVRLESTGETVVVEHCEDSACRLEDGRTVAASELWPL